MDLNNKSSIELMLNAGHNLAVNLVNTTSSVATATSVLPQLAEGLATAVTNNIDAVALGIEKGVEVLAYANLRCLARLNVLVDRKVNEKAADFYQRAFNEYKSTEKKEEEEKKVEEIIDLSKFGSF